MRLMRQSEIESAARIKELALELDYKEREFDTRLKQQELELREEFDGERQEYRDQHRKEVDDLKEAAIRAEGEAEKHKAICEEMEKRYSEEAYTKLSKILQALVVKLPTLDIKSINVAPDSERAK